MPNAYAIMSVGKNDRIIIGTQTKTPTVASVGVFYSVLGGWLIPQADYRLLVSIQPFADVVGDYTCHDREKK